ncbi:MAG: prolipoprotein diacylglyceryl transferase, partial [Ruminococcaceae bacterium]|nr:prolipoprotein diacylglyceryl transferase [Oscillospiraceae bacterium]
IGINGLGRFFIEGLRTDSLYFLGMRVSQLLAILGFIASSIALIYIRTRIKTSDDPDYLKLYVNTEQYLIDRERLEKKRNKRKTGEVVEISDVKEEISNMDSVVAEKIEVIKSDAAGDIAGQETVSEDKVEDDFALGTETEKEKAPRAYDVIRISTVKTETEKQKSETEDDFGYDDSDAVIKKEDDPEYSKKLYTKIEIDAALVYSKIIEKNKSKSGRKKTSGKTKARYSKNYNKKYKNKGSGKKAQNENRE